MKRNETLFPHRVFPSRPSAALRRTFLPLCRSPPTRRAALLPPRASSLPTTAPRALPIRARAPIPPLRTWEPRTVALRDQCGLFRSSQGDTSGRSLPAHGPGTCSMLSRGAGAAVRCFLAGLLVACSQGVAGLKFSHLVFTVEPTDTVLVRQSPALLNCSVDSSLGDVHFEWKRDGTFLNFPADGELLPGGSLLIRRITHSQHQRSREGLYQCMAKVDSVGTLVSREAKVIVASQVRLKTEPKSMSVFEGDATVLSCVAEAEPKPEVLWEKDGIPLDLAELNNSNRLVILPSGSLLINSVKSSDGGNYRCLAEGLGGNRSSDQAELSVKAEPGPDRAPGFLLEPEDITVSKGGEAHFECVASAHPRPKVNWTHNGHDINPSKRMNFIGGGALLITGVEENDAGLYTCTMDEGDDSLRREATLTVLVPPSFQKRPHDQVAREGTDIRLECQVLGNPLPLVQWMKNGDLLIPSDYFKIENNNLHILGLIKSDEGIYQCMAKNEVGNVQASSQLIVEAMPLGRKPAPAAPQDLSSIFVGYDVVKLQWNPPEEGDLISGYLLHYSHDAGRERLVNVSGQSNLKATITGLQPETEYNFWVTAYYPNSTGESSTHINVITKPEALTPRTPQNVQAWPTSATSAYVSWSQPPLLHRPITYYRLLCKERDGGPGEEQEVTNEEVSSQIYNLKKFTEYVVQVFAVNQHGASIPSEDVMLRTFSDVPSAPPQNVTAEAVNSKSVTVRWQPPPAGSKNGEIISYRIRYRKSHRRGENEMSKGSQLQHRLTGLDRASEYSIRVSAMTVNGSGPVSEWVTVETFGEDFDESRVPEQPSSLHVRPLPGSIVVSWTPPKQSDVLVRGYIIGYGVGSPYAETVRVNSKQRYYTIRSLEPNHQYVISLRAFNNMGQGVPLYESATTRPLTVTGPPTPMMPPVGVQALARAADAIQITWADNSLPKSQRITDARYYTVRWKTYFSSSAKYKMANTTTLNYLATGLKPNTLYEFSVRVIKGRRKSTWSMAAQATTMEAVPSSPPKDLTIISKEDQPRTAIVNWQPPSEANGRITGYIIYYTTDASAEIHDWVVEPVVGDRLSHQIQELTLDTVYQFKIQARNAKGMGPMSEPVVFRTPKTDRSSSVANDQASASGQLDNKMWPSTVDGDTSRSSESPGEPYIPSPASGLRADNNVLVIVIVTIGALTVLAVVIIAVACTRYSSPSQIKKRDMLNSPTGSSKRKAPPKDLKPPDLWIHHETVALKPLEKSPGHDSGSLASGIISGAGAAAGPATPLVHSSREQQMAESMSAGPGSSYSGRESDDGMSSMERSIATRQAIRPKIMVPVEPQICRHHRRPYPSPSPTPSPTPSSVGLNLSGPPEYNSLYPRSAGGPVDRATLKESAGRLPNGGCGLENDGVLLGGGSLGPSDELSNHIPPTAVVWPGQPLKSFVPVVVSAHPASPSLVLGSADNINLIQVSWNINDKQMKKKLKW
uniref:Neogenin 1 n=1 Tax=Eptatretus burgeri TaxID=7764 RepID=A0A8C4QG01_EPTBU